MPPLVLFDIDLTLVRTGGAGRVAMTQAFRDLHGRADATAGISFDGRTDRAIFLEALERNGLLGADPEAAFQAVARAYLERLPASLADREGEVLPGVEALLGALAATGAPVGLATGNLREGARAKLAHYGLWDRFLAGGFGDHETVRAEVVREAIAALARAAGMTAAPAQCVVIGDTPLDVEAARAAGARALAVATGSFSAADLAAAGADLAVDDLASTAAIMAFLGADA